MPITIFPSLFFSQFLFVLEKTCYHIRISFHLHQATFWCAFFNIQAHYQLSLCFCHPISAVCAISTALSLQAMSKPIKKITYIRLFIPNYSRSLMRLLRGLFHVNGNRWRSWRGSLYVNQVVGNGTIICILRASSCTSSLSCWEIKCSHLLLCFLPKTQCFLRRCQWCHERSVIFFSFFKNGSMYKCSMISYIQESFLSDSLTAWYHHITFST